MIDSTIKIQNSSITRFLCTALISHNHLPTSHYQPLVFINLFFISIILSLQECYIHSIIQYFNILRVTLFSFDTSILDT